MHIELPSVSQEKTLVLSPETSSFMCKRPYTLLFPLSVYEAYYCSNFFKSHSRTHESIYIGLALLQSVSNAVKVKGIYGGSHYILRIN